MSFSQTYLDESIDVIRQLNPESIEKTVELLVALRSRGGRLFIIGVGGGAGHATHAVGDFRKIAGIEAYAPSDNVAELTARTNDEGWDTVYSEWLTGSRISGKKHQRESCAGIGSRQARQRQCCRDSGAGWRLYCSSGRCLYYCSDSQPCTCDSTYRIFPGSDLASHGFSPGFADRRHEMGIPEIAVPINRLIEIERGKNDHLS